jgi:V/A-type H+-transporting ATPase subunit C
LLKEINRYGALMAKARVIRSRMLKPADYEELISKNSVAEIAAFLKRSAAYGDALRGANERTIHRDELERRLAAAYARDARKLYRFETPENQRFFKYVYMKFEIEVVKLCLRLLEIGALSGAGDVFGADGYFARHMSIDLARLSRSENLRDFLGNLAGSRYEKPLAPLLTLKEHQNLFGVETALDLFYFSQIKHMVAKLEDKADQALVKNSVGRETDMLNLLWVYRAKRYYQAPNELIYSLIIPMYHRLSPALIKELAQTETEAQFQEILRKTPYARAFEKSAGEFYEQSYERFVYDLHRKMWRAHPFSIMNAVSYLHFKEIEIKNITSVIEGVRYELPPEKIKNYIIGFEL